MRFSKIIEQASSLLRSKGRITYRALRLEFGLDEEQLDVLRDELIDGRRLLIARVEAVRPKELVELITWPSPGHNNGS